MKTHAQNSYFRILALTTATMLLTSTDKAQASQEGVKKSKQTKAIQSKKEPSKALVSSPEAVTLDYMTALTQISSTNIVDRILGNGEVNIETLKAELDEQFLDIDAQFTAIEGSNFDTNTNSLAAISAAISGISPTDLSAIEGDGFVSADNSLVAITNDIIALGSTSDISNVSARFNAVDSAIAALPTESDIADIEGSGFVSATDSLAAISLAVNSIATPANVTSLGGSGQDGQQTDISYLYTNLSRLGSSSTVSGSDDFSSIYADFASLGGSSDVSNLNARFNAVDSSIADLPTDADIALLATSAQLASAVTTLEGDITAAVVPLATTVQLNNAVAPLATSAALASDVNAIQGTGFVSADNSLYAISTAIGSGTSSGGLYKILALLVAQLIGDPMEAIDQILINPILTTTVTSDDTGNAVALLATYNTDIATARSDAQLANDFATQTYARTQTAIASLAVAQTSFTALATQWAIDNSGPNVAYGYTAAQIQTVLGELNTGLSYLLSQQVQGA